MAKKNKAYEIYGDLLYKHRPTIKTLLLDFLYYKFLENRKVKKTVYRESDNFPQLQEVKYATRSIAIVDKDGVVVEILKINELAADFLLNKDNLFIEFDPSTQLVHRGQEYRNNQFIERLKNEED